VLILVPGLGGGAGNFAVIGPALVERVPDLQVWAVDRRGDRLEDQLGFAAGEPGAAYRYYFDGLALGASRFDPNRATKTPAAKDWGLAVNLADLRAVVKRARAGGRRVLLGGHSLGAATAVAYAAWEFAGKPGHRDLAGLVLIDGGQLGTFGFPTLAQTNAALAKVSAAQPFEDGLGIGVPWLYGVFAQLAAWYALWAPDAPSEIAASPLLPPSFRPTEPVTNREFFERSLAAGGISAERCGVDGALRMVGAVNPNAFDWYFPTRLKIDLLGAARLRDDPVARRLGLRLRHLREISVPVYALATGDIPTTATGAKALLASSRSPKGKARIVSDPTMRHADPLCTPYERSPFLRTLVAWLAKR
jgi:pimeloyl-ACP methyl ester carboxylesterase